MAATGGRWSGFCEALSVHPFRVDFESAVGNIKVLEDIISLKGKNDPVGVLQRVPDRLEGIRLTHYGLFRCCKPLVVPEVHVHKEEGEVTDDSLPSAPTFILVSGDGATATSSPGASGTQFTVEADRAFLVENWPVTADAALAEIGELRKTHTVSLIPAYDVAGKLIKLYNYEAMLRGAEVDVYLHLRHWRTGKDENGKDLFGSELINVHVIRAPYSEDPATPSTKCFYSAENPMSVTYVLAEEAP